MLLTKHKWDKPRFDHHKKDFLEIIKQTQFGQPKRIHDSSFKALRLFYTRTQITTLKRDLLKKFLGNQVYLANSLERLMKVQKSQWLKLNHKFQLTESVRKVLGGRHNTPIILHGSFGYRIVNGFDIMIMCHIFKIEIKVLIVKVDW